MELPQVPDRPLGRKGAVLRQRGGARRPQARRRNRADARRARTLADCCLSYFVLGGTTYSNTRTTFSTPAVPRATSVAASASEEAAFHLAGDIGIVAAGGGRARARDLQLVDYGLDLRDLANDFFNLRLGLRGGHFAREQHRVVVAGDVDVSLALERFVDAVARRAFDPVIVEHDLELTAVGGENHPRRHAADDKGVDARLKRGGRDIV